MKMFIELDTEIEFPIQFCQPVVKRDRLIFFMD